MQRHVMLVRGPNDRNECREGTHAWFGLLLLVASSLVMGWCILEAVT
jgi:hypothetical protein